VKGGIAMFGKDDIREKSVEILMGMMDELESKPSLQLGSLDANQSVLIIMDMINGFTHEGPLASPRIRALIPEISRLTAACREKGMEMIAFADAHDPNSPEFAVYPPHSIRGTHQSQVVEEIAAIGGYKLIEKNSTNGFHELAFQEWLRGKDSVINWIIVGDCTDICIYQFATTIKTYGNTHSRDYRVIVPINAVDTYDGGLHMAELYHIVFLHSLIGNGIEIVGGIV
jgi:nicotinamidase-related amidase